MKRKSNTIKNRLLMYACFFIVPIIAFLLISNIFSIHTIRNQAYEYSKNIINMYVEQTDDFFNNIDVYLLNCAFSNSYIRRMDSASSDIERTLSKYYLKIDFESTISSFTGIDAFFTYTATSDQYVYATNYSENYSRQIEIDRYIKNYCLSIINGKNSLSDNWHSAFIKGECYIFRFFRVDDSFVGSWVNATRLLDYIYTVDIQNSSYIVFATNEGRPMTDITEMEEQKIDLSRSLDKYYTTGKNNYYLIVGEELDLGDFRIIAVLTDIDRQRCDF